MNALNHSFAPAGLSAALLALFLATDSHAVPITKAAAGTDLAAGASWSGGTAPGSGDVATWASSSLGAGLSLGVAGSWSGISVASAASAIAVTGTGTLALGAAGIDMSASSVDLNLATPIALGASQSWTVNSGRTLTASGILSGPAMVLIKGGAGTLTIYGLTANTYSGGTVVSSGTVHCGTIVNSVSPLCTGVLGTGPVTLNGGTIEFDRVTAANALTVTGGMLYSQNGWGATWSGPITLNANLTCNTLYNMTCSGAISGTFGLNKTGGATLYLSGTNTFTGPTTVTSGTLECDNANSPGGGALSISSGAKVNLNYTGTKSIASVTLGGVPQIGGTHGSTASTATNKNDTYFSGSGTVTVPLSAAKDILACSFGTLGAAGIGTSTVNLDVPIGTDRTALAPTLSLSPGATCSPASGIAENFTSAQTYTVTAQDGSTKAYTVTVTEAVLPNIFTWATATSGNLSDASKWTNEAVPVIVVAPQSGGRATYTLNFNIAGTYTAARRPSPAPTPWHSPPTAPPCRRSIRTAPAQ